MNLYLLTQGEETGYDTYDSVVVAAKSEDEARNIHPNEWSHNPWKRKYVGDWCKEPESVIVELIGEAVKGTQAGVILASFNASQMK